MQEKRTRKDKRKTKIRQGKGIAEKGKEKVKVKEGIKSKRQVCRQYKKMAMQNQYPTKKRKGVYPAMCV